MIVHPDFFDHWKTKLLVTLTKDEAAPLMVLRLWAYCQTKRTGQFVNLSDATLVGICHAKIQPSRFREILLECQFIKQAGETTIAHGWEELNASLFASWRNGLRSKATHRQPTGIPRLTHRQPTSSISISKKSTDIETPGNPRVPDDQPKPNPENIKKFGSQLAELTRKLKVQE